MVPDVCSTITGMKKLVVGILAHVDAGKTTCIEGMLYKSGRIRKLGRVDHRDAFLDYDAEERSHGITIYSKEANFAWKDAQVYVIDTPGHADFSSEMERCLQALDLAIILINGQDGVQSHTETIWNCLEHYQVPALIFVNKMDISYRSREELLQDLAEKCSDNCIDFAADDRDEKLALVNETLLNEVLEGDGAREESIAAAVKARECFPVFFGSALKLEGLEALMDMIASLAEEKDSSGEFGARVYKISSDEQGNRLTHVRITSGSLKAKQKIGEEEKADQLRLYNGHDFEMINEAENGTICVIKGLEKIEEGAGLGIEENGQKPILNAFMSYELLLPAGANVLALAETCRQMADEDPALQMVADPESGKITLQMMGEMQKEILEKKIRERSGIAVGFGTGRIIYRETITESVVGAGHFEPLRHYAEAQVRLTPLARGSGIVIANDCPTDILSATWQRAILAALRDKHHRGVLTGAELTDVKITLLAGKGHIKHTEGGDFRQAASRAVRQALMKTESILLEPYYSFELTVPPESLSRALFELETKQCTFEVKEQTETKITVTGRGAVRLLTNYQTEVLSYTKGQGRFSCTADGYDLCKDRDEIVAASGYDPERDMRNPTGSVFCTHGSGYYVPWYEVEDHVELITEKRPTASLQHRRYNVSENDMDRILEMSTGRNRNEHKQAPKKKEPDEASKHKTHEKQLPDCLIIDGYNMIFSWKALQQAGEEDITTAREKLIDMIHAYQGYTRQKTIIVFDGYKAKGNIGSETKRGDLSIVYTRTGQTADQYIERLCAQLKGTYRLTVASSDGLIQNSVFSHGAMRMSARELENLYQLRTRAFG